MSQSVILSSINKLTQAKKILCSMNSEICMKCCRVFQNTNSFTTHSIRCNGDLNMSPSSILNFVNKL